MGVAEQVQQQQQQGGANGSAPGLALGSKPGAFVTFRAQRKVKYGQVLKLVGSPSELGGWDCAKAPGEAGAWEGQAGAGRGLGGAGRGMH